DALHLLGVVRMEQNRFDEALDFLNRSLAARPGHPDVRINLGKTLKFLGRDAEARTVFGALLETRPDLAEALYELAELQYRGGDSDGAETNFRKLLALEPHHLQAGFFLGLICKDSGRPAEAEAFLATGLIQARQSGMKAAFLQQLALAQYQQGKKKESLGNFALAARLDPLLNADINRADILAEMHRFEEAAQVLEQLLAREPENAAAHAAYNKLLHQLGRDAEFLTSYDRAPKNPALLAGKAGLLLKKGRPAEAHGLYAEALKSMPESAEAAIGAATALNELKRPQEAAAVLEQALKHNPQSPALYQDLASTLLQSRDPQKAAAMAEQALRLAPTDQAGLAVLGTAWRMMGDARDEVLNGYDDLIRIFDLEPPDGFSHMEDFNAELNAWLAGLHADTREPLEQSLRGGSQTRGFIFGQGHVLAEKLKQRIDEAMERYLAAMKPDDRHPFRSRRGRGFRLRDSWSSRLHDKGFHVNHIHPGGWISSCYYVALPQAVKDENGKQGWIKFGQPSFDAGLSMRRAIQPRPGRLVLFPSYMWHGTIPFREDTARTTVAFDAVPL
ncbi:MAG TPA: tetratricopeptide repeat protein, partial [Rhizomicrobium sp.]|nr:tetratricopeptide repeat protein [Rhizomicrobium sp.]